MAPFGHPVRSVTHTVRRLAIPLGMPYEESVAAFERTVPQLDPAPFHALSEWHDVVALAEKLAPLGFFRFHKLDVTPFMAVSGSRFACAEYLMGNHVIAERMYRHDPTVMLHAPLRLLIQADENGDGVLVLDQPGTLFASFDDDRIAEVGRELDVKLAGVVSALGAQPPPELSSH
ncbi:hypothetical protein [Pseudonocardia spinosispora]|uniref:hypothetical protein n=1 Tax=Pseudonocardia spinosispora TaxID=103441 RepID=UPI0004046679|nr:hypothetical protein [Pseudonocardia spinosispora]